MELNKVGATVALTEGNLHLFIGQPLFLLIAADSAWVSGAIVRAYRMHETIYREADTLFHYESKTRHLKAFIATLRSDKQILIFSLIPIVFLDSTIVLVGLRLISDPQVLYNLTFSSQADFIYVVAAVTLAGYIYGMGVYLLVRHTIFVRALSKQPLDIALLEHRLLRHGTKKLKELKDVVRFSFDTSVVWLVAVFILALAVSSVGQFENACTLAFLGISIVLALALFFIPQFDLHKSIVNGKDRLKEDVLRRFELEWGPVGPKMPSEQRSILLNLIDHIEKLEAWPGETEYVVLDIAISFIPIALKYVVRL